MRIFPLYLNFVLRAQNVQKQCPPTDTKGKCNISLRSDYCAFTGVQKKVQNQNKDIDRRHKNMKPCVLRIRNVATKCGVAHMSRVPKKIEG
jgi:hypothetical protein